MATLWQRARLTPACGHPYQGPRLHGDVIRHTVHDGAHARGSSPTRVHIAPPGARGSGPPVPEGRRGRAEPAGRRAQAGAQWLTRCRASHLAEAQRLSSALLRPSPAKRRASSRSSRAHGHHLRPSTHGETWSECGFAEGLPLGWPMDQGPYACCHRLVCKLYAKHHEQPVCASALMGASPGPTRYAVPA